MLKTSVAQLNKKNMRSKSPFKQDKCTTAWAKWEEGYRKVGKDKPEEKFKGRSEMEVERGEFECRDGKIKLKKTDDAERPIETKKEEESPAKKTISVSIGPKHKY